MRLGLRLMRFRIMRPGHPHLFHGFVESELAVAAVAAALAFRAQVVAAGILRAVGTDRGGQFLADITRERHSVVIVRGDSAAPGLPRADARG